MLCKAWDIFPGERLAPKASNRNDSGVRILHPRISHRTQSFHRHRMVDVNQKLASPENQSNDESAHPLSKVGWSKMVDSLKMQCGAQRKGTMTMSYVLGATFPNQCFNPIFNILQHPGMSAQTRRSQGHHDASPWLRYATPPRWRLAGSAALEGATA